jgi:hypothetical protein
MPYFNNTLVVPKPVLWYSCPLAVSHWLYHTGCKLPRHGVDDMPRSILGPTDQ